MSASISVIFIFPPLSNRFFILQLCFCCFSAVFPSGCCFYSLIFFWLFLPSGYCFIPWPSSGCFSHTSAVSFSIPTLSRFFFLADASFISLPFYFFAAHTYPIPYTVLIYCGFAGSSSSLPLSLRMVTDRAFSST